MKLTTENKEEIKTRFLSVETVEQLAELFQWIYDLKFPKKDPKLKLVIQAKHLNYYAFKKKDRYVNFEIPKKNKKETRPISAPKYKLKAIQKCINEILNAVFESHNAAFGFIPNRSVVDNAKLHVGKNFVYNIDIENFFPSTEFRRVKTVLGLKPFNLKDEKEKLSFLIANLCCEEGKLPQGAPTSPTLTNIVCQNLDWRLSKLAKRYRAVYSRYADDITFSAYTNIFGDKFKEELKEIIEVKENYKINYSKERLQDWNKRQEVTGVIVNKKTNVNREYIKDIRFWLNYWENESKKDEPTQIVFERFYRSKNGSNKKRLRNNHTPPFINYLNGKLLYLGMVRGKEDKMYQGFMTRFVNQSISYSNESKGINMNELLSIWEQKGIEEAMQFYFNLKNKDGAEQSGIL
ncbi:MAG: hypothetical protein POELPBGB_02211 [Bacteroidia bacterium]|nr:hypothetical protein [Bacteroidia bacterium]